MEGSKGGQLWSGICGHSRIRSGWAPATQLLVLFAGNCLHLSRFGWVCQVMASHEGKRLTRLSIVPDKLCHSFDRGGVQRLEGYGYAPLVVRSPRRKNVRPPATYGT